ncbi:MAG TPA: PorV/PorQ family protein [Saprospiraceae bacterium]|nr:PorV/PorQ family protein [Saprospiraceae bacterium]
MTSIFTKTMRWWMPVVMLCGFISNATAQKYSNEFLSIGVGARAQGMGMAVIAGGSDVTSGVWNPAGLAGIDLPNGFQLGAMHSEWFGGVGKFDYAGVVLPLANNHRRLGLSFIRFGIDQIPNTLTLYEDDGTVNYDNVSEFSAADYAFVLSYAQLVKPEVGKLAVGGNIKIVHRRIGPFATSWGFGADLGLQYRLNKWRLGVLARDITTTFNAWAFSFTDEQKEVLSLTNNEIPINSVEITRPQIILDITRRFEWKNVGISPEIDLIATTDGRRNTLISAAPFSIDPAIGLELDYKQKVFLRGGASQFQREMDFGGKELLGVRPAIGVGLKVGALNLDYAFTDLGSQQNTFSHVVSVMLNVRRR